MNPSTDVARVLGHGKRSTDEVIVVHLQLDFDYIRKFSVKCQLGEVSLEWKSPG